VALCLLIGIRRPKEIADATGIAPNNVSRTLAKLNAAAPRMEKEIDDIVLEIHALQEKKNSISRDSIFYTEKRSGIARKEKKCISPDTSSFQNSISGDTISEPEKPGPIARKERKGISPDTFSSEKSISPDTIGGFANTLYSKEKKEIEEKNKISPSATDTEDLRVPEKYRRPTVEECIQYFINGGSTAVEGEKYFNHYAARDWMAGRTHVAYWKIQAKIWMTNLNEWKKERTIETKKPKEAWQVSQDDKITKALIEERQTLINQYRLPSRSTHLMGKMQRVKEIQDRLDALRIKYENKI
jgi:hypothetical protein